MDQLVISLLSPVPPRRIEHWVERQVDRLRARAGGGGVRLGRLARSAPSRGGHWLIEVDRDDRDMPPEEDVVLATVITEMAAIGLRPYLFVISREPGARRARGPHRAGGAVARAQPARHARVDCRSSRVR